MTNTKVDLDTLFRLKSILEGLYKGNHPSTDESIGYNRAINDVMKEVMAMIHKTLDAQMVKTMSMKNNLIDPKK